MVTAAATTLAGTSVFIEPVEVLILDRFPACLEEKWRGTIPK